MHGAHEVFRRRGVERAQAGELGGAVQDAVQAAKFARDRVGHGFVVGGIRAGQVERIQGRLTTHGLEGVVGAAELGHLAAKQHQRRAGGGAGAGRSVAQAAVGAGHQDHAAGERAKVGVAAHGGRGQAHAGFCASATMRASSPLWNNSTVMSQPPISSPLMNSCGKVGQSE